MKQESSDKEIIIIITETFNKLFVNKEILNDLKSNFVI